MADIQYNLFSDEDAQEALWNLAPKRQADLQAMEAEQIQQYLSEPTDRPQLGVYLSYKPVAGQTIIDKGKTYYKQHIDEIKGVLNTSGVTKETADVVILDYGNALLGNFIFSATAAQMTETLNKLKLYKAYFVDKYGFYRLLLQQYQRYTEIYYHYFLDIKNSDTDVKEKFLHSITLKQKGAVVWAIENDFIRFIDFDGVKPNLIWGFIAFVSQQAALYSYGEFYHLAKYAYMASQDELNAIAPPEPISTELKKTGYEDFADGFCDVAELELKDDGAELSANIEKLSDAQTPQEQEQARGQITKWKPTDSLSLNKTFLSLQSRGVYAAPTGDVKGGMLPIKSSINEFLTDETKNKLKITSLTPTQVEQAIDGVSRMMLDKQPFKTLEGYYKYKTNLSEFSRFCRLNDANNETNKKLFAALRLIDYAAWLVVWKATGPTAVRVLTIQEITPDGDFTILVSEEALKERPIFITRDGYEKLKAKTKGRPKERFDSQILLKPHKEEEALINECFDYETKLRYAIEESIEESKRQGLSREQTEAAKKAAEKKFNTYWRKKKPSYKKQIRSWFDEAQNNGVITYEVKVKNGKTIYSWRLTDEAKGKQAQQTEPIQDAEIIEDEQPKNGQ